VPIITQIKPQKNQQRFNIYLDGKFAFTLSAEALIKAGLKVNQKISQKKAVRLNEQDNKDKLYEKVLRFLSYRPRSEKEIRDYLKKKNASQKTSKAIIKKLKKLELIDDRSFALWWIQQRSSFRPRGRRALWFELKQKGIDQEIIKDSLFSDKKELVLAKKAAQKKAKFLKNLEFLAFRQKMTGFLARRGFDWETIKKVLEELKKKE